MSVIPSPTAPCEHGAEHISPADALNRLFAAKAPQAAAIAAPFIRRLFAAMSEGHTFIYLSAEEQTELARAAPITGRNADSPLVLHGRRLFTAKSWQNEQALAAEIRRLSAARLPEISAGNAAIQLARWFDTSGSQDQQTAAALALLKPFLLISGGPGTGKTTTVAKLLALLCRPDCLPRIVLTAPTGKAAARVSESLHRAAAVIPDLHPDIQAYLSSLQGQTVHRLLGLKPPQMLPEYHSDRQLPADILLVDEASMLDNHLFHNLLSATPTGCRVILLGDTEQLPAIGAGAVLSALAKPVPLQTDTLAELQQLLPQHTAFPTLSERHARLTISHRFGADSGIGTLAQAVLSGDGQAAWHAFSQFGQQISTQERNDAKLLKLLFRRHQDYWQAVSENNIQAAFAAQTRLMILTASRQDAAHINHGYRTLLQQQGLAQKDTPWFAGQPVMITRNDPIQQLFNGDIGIVLPHQNALHAFFPAANGTFRHIPVSRLPEHDTAFAITVHKSQGSEYEQIWFVAPTDGTNYGRALLYTALTRARKHFVYWGSQTGFQAACKHKENRLTALSDFLLTGKN